MLSPPKPLDEIQPNLVCELLTWIDAQHNFFLLTRPPGEGSKGQISFNFNYKVNFRDFYSKLCVCSHKWKVQNILDGFFYSLSPGSCLRGGTWGYLLAKIKFRPAVCPLSPPKPLDEIQPKFGVWVTHMNGTQSHFFWPRPLGPWGGVKRSNIIYFRLQSQFQRFLFQTLCVFSQMKGTKHFRRVFILSPGSYPWGGTWGYLGAKIKFRPAVCPLCYLLLNHWTKFNPNLVYELLTWMERKVNFFFAPPPGSLRRGQKVKYHLISITKSISKIFIRSHKWKIQTISDGIFIM